LDALKPLKHKLIIERELEGFGIRINQTPPDISFKKKDKGGLTLSTTVKQSQLDEETVREILKEYKCPSADVILKCDATIDQ
jgi:ribosome-interacting GTPase 1